MTIILLLLLFGLVMVFLEFYLPGGVMAIVGSILLLLSIAFFIMKTDSSWLAVLAIFVVAALVGGTIALALKLISRGKANEGFYLPTDQAGYRASEFPEELIGKKGTALTDLRPSGHITVEGKRLQAEAQTGHIEKDSEVTVVSGEGAHLIVKRTQDNIRKN